MIGKDEFGTSVSERGEKEVRDCVFVFLQGLTVQAFHSHLRLKIDVCKLENVFRSISANTIQNSLTYTVAYNERINLFRLFMET